MLIGAYGLHWRRDQYRWTAASQRRILGTRKEGRATVTADFSGARGIYVLYRDDEIYYVGETKSYGMFSGRLSDHANSTSPHAEKWDAFSWFSFDSPEDEAGPDGVLDVDGSSWDYYHELSANDAIDDLEAILIALLAPPGNSRNERLKEAERWTQVLKT